MTMAFIERRTSISAQAMPVPLFELTGALSRIDLSAWLSGLTFALGLMLIGPEALSADIAAGGLKVLGLLTAYALFIASVLAIQHYMHLKLTATTFGQPQQLVTSGIFQISRNPIYVAFFLPIAALALFSPLASLVSLGFYVTAMTLTVIRREERDLQAAFGYTFTAYAARVPRWLF